MRRSWVVDWDTGHSEQTRTLNARGAVVKMTLMTLSILYRVFQKMFDVLLQVKVKPRGTRQTIFRVSFSLRRKVAGQNDTNCNIACPHHHRICRVNNFYGGHDEYRNRHFLPIGSTKDGRLSQPDT